MEKIEQFFTNLGNLLVSPRFKSFYWRTGAMAAAGFLTLVTKNLTALEIPAYLVVPIGLMLGEISKGLSNLAEGKEMGFSPK